MGYILGLALRITSNQKKLLFVVTFMSAGSLVMK
jgi:hypothetical protein